MKMKKVMFLFLALILVALPVIAAEQSSNQGQDSKQTEQKQERIAAVVNDKEITVTQLDKEINLQSLISRLAQVDYNFVSLLYTTEAGSQLLDEYRKQNLDSIIVKELLSQKAKEENITLSDEKKDELFQEQIKNIKESNNITEDQLLSSLKQQGIESMDAFKKVFFENNEDILLINELQKQIFDTVKVTDEQVKDYYNSNIDNYKVEAGTKVSHILVEEKDKAEELLKQLKNGADFAELAKENSIDKNSAVKGGDLGYISLDNENLDKNFKEAVKSLKVGEMSEVVKSGYDYGYHIIKVTDRREAGTVPFEDVKDDIKQGLLQQKKQQAFSDYIDKLKEEAKIERRL